MYEALAQKHLKSGEQLEVGVVVAPDETFQHRIKSFLIHKPYYNYRWHIDCAFEPDRIQGLETRFYLGLLEDRPIVIL